MASVQRRVAKDGTITWRVRVRVVGCPIQTESFRRKTDAIAWATKTEAAIRDGQAMPDRRERERTVRDLTAHYRATTLTAYSPRERRKRSKHLDFWDQQLGHRRVVDLKPPHFSEVLRKLAAGEGVTGEPVGPATQVRHLATIRHVFSVAGKDWGWIAHNPAAHVRTPKEPRGRLRYLSEEESARLLAICKTSRDARLYPLVAAALSTGARQGELLNLRWGDVDLVAGRAIVQESKNDERRTLALAGTALAALRELGRVRRIGVDWVFASARGIPSLPRLEWEAAVKAAGLEDFHFHDLRHTCASRLAMSGATLAEIAAALGHKTLAMVKRYAHLSEGHTASVVERMLERFPL